MDPGSSRRRASGHSQAQPRHRPQRGRAAVTGAAEATSVDLATSVDPVDPATSVDPVDPATSVDPVTPVTPVIPVIPVAPVAPVAPVEGPAGTAGLSDSGGGSSRSPGRPVQEIVFPTREQYLSVVQGYRDDGFEMCIDLCGVDYLTHFNRHLPDGVPPERFEVVVNLLSLSTARRVRLRVQLPESHLEVASIFD